MTESDLNNCDMEPIHIPGKIQSYGFLVVINTCFHITYLSENVEDYIGIAPVELLGKPIESISSFLGNSFESQFISALINSVDVEKKFEFKNPLALNFGNRNWLLIVHKTGEHYLLDFEPEIANLEVDIQYNIASSLSRILSNANLEDILVDAAKQIREIIHYDRVMIYKFHHDGHGEVIAEDKKEKMESWLGLHYPASDIPKQARELYKLNLTRLISDVHVPPVGIVTQEAIPLDLTESGLRAVSPIHIQYLKNMGVTSSFSVSIICNNDLWGLIACHNYSPRFINYPQRQSAKLLGQILSSAIDLKQKEAVQAMSQYHQKALDKLTRYLYRDFSLGEALFKQDFTIKDMINSSGAVLFFENQINKTGQVPDDRFLVSFCKWLSVNMKSDVFYTHSLSTEFAEAESYADNASGVLVCRVGKSFNEFIIWFRPEMPTVVNWAGNKEKLIEEGSDGLPFISPRKSFEIWSELVRNSSEPWEIHEVNCALQLRDEIVYSINRKVMELRVLNEKLSEAYAELDAFAHTIAHDLRNPLTAIKGYAQIIKSGSDEDELEFKLLNNIESRVNKMDNMIEEILSYSKVGQYKLTATEINMEDLLSEIKSELTVNPENPHLNINIITTPNLYGDRLMVTQIFSNIIANAVKYSSLNEFPTVVVKGEELQDHVLYTVTDNGIGIKSEDYDRIFELFTRSSNASKFKGSGVGLSIVNRMMKKHNAAISVFSELGKGSNFYLKFAKKHSYT